MLVLALAAAYGMTAYVALPAFWRARHRHHPALEDLPQRSTTREGLPGDPINLAVVASDDEVHRLLVAAGWLPADARTFRSSVRIVADVLARRPYDLAPVSDLYLWGRRQDLAFEQPAGHDPRRRHHVRFWRSEHLDAEGRPLWAGAATFDERAGVSHRTGQVTHHIARDVDAERDKLLADLEATGSVEVSWIDGFQSQLHGRNGGGDPYDTDGRLAVASARGAPE